MEYGSARDCARILTNPGQVSVGNLVANEVPFIIAETVSRDDSAFNNPGAQRVFDGNIGQFVPGDTFYARNDRTGQYLGRWTVLDIADATFVGRLSRWTVASVPTATEPVATEPVATTDAATILANIAAATATEPTEPATEPTEPAATPKRRR